MATTNRPSTDRPKVQINVFAPSFPHAKQEEVLDFPARFKVLRAGRKFRKTSLGISWLAEGALQTGLTCPYVAPNRVQAKNIAWRDHVSRLLDELRKKNVPHKVNEVELSVSFPHGGRIQLLGVENKEALRGISNWGRFFGDEVDDWEEDIWPTIIRPNLIVHKAPAIMAGTPKGERILYRLSRQAEFQEFHYTSYDNPDLDREELEALVKEYRSYGEDYYNQEIMAEYIMPVGLVYRDWKDENYQAFDYDPFLPLHLSMDFGVNDPTAIIWFQTNGSEIRVIDYYEQSDADLNHFIQVIRSKPYKQPELVCGDPAGNARTLTTGTSPIQELAKAGIFVSYRDGVKIPEQIRATHQLIPNLFVSSSNPSCGRFKSCLRNYRYPDRSTALLNQSNEIPIHDQFSHAMRALEYYAVNVADFKRGSLQQVGVMPGLGGIDELPIYDYV